MTRLRRVAVTACVALVGYGIGWVVGAVRTVLPRAGDTPFLAERVPLPHHVPEHPGGASLRFAMVQDLIHERFPKHGPAYYAERNRLTRARLDGLAADDPARFPLLDDLGAGLERLGQSGEAATLLRGKLDAQRRLGLDGRDLYTSFANLGTFLIHASLAEARKGDPAARDQFRSGIEFIRDAVRVNPEAHFGRERWQAAIAEFLMAAIDDPQLLRKFDCLGNRLDVGIEAILNRETNWVENGYGRPTDAAFSRWQVADEVPEFFRPGVAVDAPALWPILSPVRRHITRVGAEAEWADVAVPSHRNPVPFDEPTLGIIGMWQQGGGANPHFALALGETMLRVGQRPLAWVAFERAGRLADRFWPEPALVEFVREHCRRRQGEIEATFGYEPPEEGRRVAWQAVSPRRPRDNAASMRARFDAELAFGQSYQRRYQEAERARIEAGAAVDDPHFEDRFDPGPTPIASPVGPEEWFEGVPPAKFQQYAKDYQLACGLFGAGCAAMSTALVFHATKARPKPSDFRSKSGGLRDLLKVRRIT